MLFSKDTSGIFDFGASSIHSGIDALDFNNGFDDTVYLDIRDILSSTDEMALFIRGDDGQDHVVARHFTSDKRENETLHKDGIEYAVYSNGAAEFFVQLGLTVNNRQYMA